MTCALICGYRCLSANEESCLTNDDEESELICKKKFYIDPPIIFLFKISWVLGRLRHAK